MLPLELFERYFSNYSPHAIEYRGACYPTVEHAYHCARYEDPAVIEKIRNAPTPLAAWEISQTYKPSQVAGFDEKKVAVMEELLRVKLSQHEDVRKALVDSGDLRIVKHITAGPPADGFWDDGKDGTGRNVIGTLWMQLREELNRKLL